MALMEADYTERWFSFSRKVSNLFFFHKGAEHFSQDAFTVNMLHVHIDVLTAGVKHDLGQV